MTKAEILKLAENVELMDELNTISGLLEINTPDNEILIESCVKHILEVMEE